ncbi:MAG: PP2C family protein-serine/threonine phosphatase [Anaerolineae bacterium]|nr:PP2C family protein-serine/threonine phosphatase [Anaerolineae bacterium]
MSGDGVGSVLQHDLEVAASIQRSFLPDRLPNLPGAELAASMRPARDVGGDFYDAIPLPGGRLGLLIADVSGKGIPAALYMALARTLLRTHSLSAQPRYLTDALESAQVRRLMRSGSLGALAALGSVRQANDYLLVHHHEPVMFLTLFYVVYEPQSRLLTYVNAGHNPPLLHRASSGEQEWLAPTDVAIGLMPGRLFESQERRLDPGDVLVLYTDGVTEAVNPEMELFETERLAAAVRSLAERSAGEILAGIADHVAAFSAGAPQADDLTMAVLKVQP